MTYEPKTFNIIKFAGDPEKVTLYDGTVIDNNHEEFIFIPEYNGMVRKAPYGVHFVFEVPKHIKGGSSFLCSCGSPAVFIGSKDYSQFGSPEGMMLVCLTHTTYGKHADGIN